MFLFPGVLGIPLFLGAAAWFGWLGARLWSLDPGVVRRARATYRISLVLGALLIVYGAMALRAAARSADTGGGLLGTFGLVPIVAGVAGTLLPLLGLRGAAALNKRSGG
jgi:hypothetical protein